MAVQIDKIVNVNFTTKKPTALIGSYPVTVVISKEAKQADETFGSFEDYIKQYSSGDTNLYSVGDTYFNKCGGNILRIIKRESDETIPTVLSRIKGDFIFFYVADTIISSECKATGEYLESLNSPNHKIFVITDQEASAKGLETGDECLAGQLKQYNYIALQYSSKNKHAALAIAAYFSNINLGGIYTFKDYMYTPSAIKTEEVTPLEYDTLISRHYNFSDSLANYNGDYMFGGDMVNGVGLDVTFGVIAVEKDVTHAILDLIVEKLPMSDRSTSIISNAISSVLTRYVINGFLLPGKQYVGENDHIVMNGIEYNLIRKNQILTDGYEVFVLPISSLTDDDKAQRKAPAVFVYIANAGSIRKINIEGVVI